MPSHLRKGDKQRPVRYHGGITVPMGTIMPRLGFGMLKGVTLRACRPVLYQREIHD